MTASTLKTRSIENDPDLLEAFLKNFEMLAKNPVELSYLKRATVRGFFKNDVLVAGYVSNKQAPYRLLNWLPEDTRYQLIEQHIPGGESSCCELTCMWKDRSSVSYWEMNCVYVVAIYDAVRSGKRNILGGSFVNKLAVGQARILGNIVYSGPSSFRDGEHCAVYFTTRFGALWGIVREVSLELWKLTVPTSKSNSKA